MTTSGPSLRAQSPRDRELVDAYDAWRRHFEACNRCVVNSSATPDAICKAGRVLFNRWDRLSARHTPSSK